MDCNSMYKGSIPFSLSKLNNIGMTMERELLVEKAGSKGWSISDDGILISCHATSKDAMAEAFRLSEMRNPPIKIVVDCTGE
tara:strand:- start:64 stop:309 length:246 start_codon:yes stop_codon:yes gene_type:complete